jgi:FKBP12-rapamycin complex-associated protein
MNESAAQLIERKLEDMARYLETKKEKDRQDIYEEKIAKVREALLVVINDKKLELNDRFLLLIIQNYFKSNVEARIVLASIIINLYIERERPAMTSILEITNLFIRSAKKTRQFVYSDYLANLYGTIIQVFSNGIIQILESHVHILIEDITENYAKLLDERYIVYSLLYQIIRSKHYLILKEIKNIELIVIFKNIMRERSSEQAVSLLFIKELLSEISKLDKEEQKSCLAEVIIELQREVQDVRITHSENFYFSFFVFFKYIFQFINRSFFSPEENSQLYENILKLSQSQLFKKNPKVCKVFFEIAPLMVNFNSALYYKSFLSQLVTSLLKLADELKEADLIESLFKCFHDIVVIYNSDSVSTYSESIFFKIIKVLESWPEKLEDKFEYVEIFQCLKLVIKFLKNIQKGNEVKVNSLVDKILIYGFNQVTLRILQQLHKSHNIYFNSLIETKLRYTIAIILKKNMKAFEDEQKEVDELNTSLTLKKYSDNNFKEMMMESSESKDNYFTPDYERRENSTPGDEQPILDTTIHKLLENNNGEGGRHRESFLFDQNEFFLLNRKLYLEEFANKLENYYKDDKKFRYNPITESKISIALEALAKFDFGAKTNAKRSIFIKDTVLAYLESTSAELRKRAARIVFHLSSDQNPPFKTNLSLSNKIIQGIINKMMSIAIGDPDNNVREETLTALNSKSSHQFIPYLVSEENLKKLIILVYDMNYKIQKQSILLLEKLIPTYPELLNRFDQIIFRTISFLGTHNKNFGEEDKNHVKILQIIAKHSQFLIDGRLPVIASLLVDILSNCMIKNVLDSNDNYKQDMITVIFKCLARVFDFQPMLSRQYFQKCLDIFFINIKRLDDVILTYLFRCIIVLTRNSNYQLILVIKYNIYQYIFDILDRNVPSKLRSVILKLIGTIGAIDPSMIKKIIHMRNNSKIGPHMTILEVEGVFQKLRKKTFNFEKHMHDDKNPKEDALVKNFEDFKNNVKLIQKNIKGQSAASLTTPKSKVFKNVIMDLKQKFVAMQVATQEQAAVEASLTYKIQNQDSLLKFVTSHTLNILFNTIESPRDEEVIRMCLDSIQQIILNLGRNISEFKEVVFNRLIGYFYKNAVVKFKILTLQNIKYFIKAYGIDISKENDYISVLIKLLIRFFPNEDYHKELFSICRLLIDYKMSLRHRFKDIITTLLSMLLTNPTQPYSKDIFELILHLDNHEYLYLITPAFIKLSQYFKGKQAVPKKTQNDIMKMIFSYFDKIKTTKHFEHFSGNIIRAAIAMIGDYPELMETIQSFLIEIIRSLRERCFNYLSLIHPFLVNNPAYIQILVDLDQKGYIEEAPLSNNRSMDDVNNFPTLNESETNLQAHSIRAFNYEAIKNAFMVANSSKSHNWEDWFNRLTIELISNSPSTILIACKSLIFYQDIMKQLFKPAFVMFWSQLKDQQRAQILRGFDTIISNPSRIPLRVRKEIIELVEFMSHENKYGLVLDITKLAEFSLKCHSIYKAIFFKELEFQNNPENAIEILLKLYSEAGYKYAAEGLLEYAQNTLKLSVKTPWLKSMGQWDKIYIENKGETNEENYELQILCNLELSNWEWVLDKIKDVVKKARNSSEISVSQQLSGYGAKAAFHLSRWDALESYSDTIHEDKDFYNGVININHNNFKTAKEFISESVRVIEKESQSLANYSTAYEKIVQLQNIVELEEIVCIRQRFQSLSENELYHYIVSEENQEKEKQEYRTHILKVWEDRINSSEENIQHWQKILATRRVFCEKSELLISYLKFAKMCFNNDNSLLYTRTLSNLKNEIFKMQSDIELVTLAQIECEYKTGKIQQTQVISMIEDLSSKKSISKNYKPFLYLKLGTWLLKSEIIVEQRHEKVIKFLEKSLAEIKDNYRLWHYYAVANYDMVRELEKVDDKSDVKIKYLRNALEGFTRSISIETRPNGKYTIQDLLRLLELWYEYHDIDNDELKTKIEKSVEQIQNRDWILIAGQIIARLEQKESFSSAVRNILISLAKEYPQNLIFPLLIAKRSKNINRSRMANRIIIILKETHSSLVQDATVFSEELIRISVLFEEQWYHGFGEAYRYRQENNLQMVLYILNTLFANTSRNILKPTLNEIAFFHQYGTLIKKAEEYIEQYYSTKNEICFLLAWDTLYNLYKELETSFKNKTGSLYLENVSPSLLAFKNSTLVVPGTNKLFSTKNTEVRIALINPTLKLLNSKRKPRKLSLYGTNSKEYSFLLKGNEDLRQDERVMQLLNLVNDLLKTNASLDNHSLKIVTFNVLPLSYNCGIISWLEGSDTIHELIRDYREKIKVNVFCERKLVSQFCENYDILSKMKKLETFKFVCDNTKGEDLKKIFWLRSPSAEVWLSHRNNFICSCAVMSMVGYILGLGDRHLMNIMLEKSTGRIVHIDYGDCFENASLREKLPEKVPFRLTRVLVNAMEACGTEGTFKSTCEKVMNIMRSNKEVILALLEEFICDPIITWRLINESLSEINEDEKPTGQTPQIRESKVLDGVLDPHLENLTLEENFKKEGIIEMEMKIKLAQTMKNKNNRKVNSKAFEALQRIRNKLAGRDFENIDCDYKTQVRKLIKQATSIENISQSFTGWNPFL